MIKCTHYNYIQIYFCLDISVQIRHSMFHLRKYTIFQFVFYFFVLFLAILCGILVLQPRVEPLPPAVEAQSPNRWTTREFPEIPLRVGWNMGVTEVENYLEEKYWVQFESYWVWGEEQGASSELWKGNGERST